MAYGMTVQGPAQITAMEDSRGRWTLWLVFPAETFGPRRHDRYGRASWATKAEALASIGR